MAAVTVYHAGRRVEYVHLDQGLVSIGRDPTSRIVLSDHQVSWAHGLIKPSEKGYLLTDCGSTNGILVNGVSSETWHLQDQDIVSIGEYQLVFSEEAAVDHHYAGSEKTMAIRGEIRPALQAVLDTAALSSTPMASARWWRWLMAFFPALGWLLSYDRHDFRSDLQAGVTVAALLVPQGMAYALLAGMPPINGLYASTLPLVFYALSGTSRQLSVAPVALDSLLVASGIAVLAETGTEQFVHLAIVLALIVGVLQCAMGLLRMGFVVNFLSQPVLTGFTAAAALIIAVSQLRHLLGLPMAAVSGFFPTVKETFLHLPEAHFWTAGLGVAGVIYLIFGKRLRLPLPGAIVLLIVSTVLSWWLMLAQKGVAVVGAVPQGLPIPALVIPSLDEVQALFPLALTLACIGFMEAISVGKAFASRYGYRVNADAEFRALGFSNMGAHLVGGFPVTGGLSRSAVNADAGARTQLAAIISAVLVILVLLFFTPFFYHVPIASLAAIIMTSVMGLIKIDEMKYLVRVKKVEGIVLLVTLLATLFMGISTGLLAGIGSAMLLFIIVQTRPNMSLLGRLPGTQVYRSLERHPEAETITGLAILRIDASFYFANAESLRDQVAKIMDRVEPPQTIVLDATAVNDLDSSGDTAFREIYRDLNRRNIALYVAGLKGPVRDVLKRSGLYDQIGAQYFFYTVDAAVKRITTVHKITG